MIVTAPIGVIGLGEMGGAIAQRLHRIEAPVLVHDLDTSMAAAWPADAWSPDAVDLAARCSTILVVVATDEQVGDVVAALSGYVTPGTVVVLHSTVAPGTAVRAAEVLEDAGAHLIDAGMSRSTKPMCDGGLTLFVGGDAEVLGRVRPVLRLFSDTILHVGGVGAGMIVKLCNNLALHGNRLILLEAARLAAGNGVRIEDLVTGLRTSTGDSWVARHWGRTDLAALADGTGQVPMVTRTERELGLALDLADQRSMGVPAARLVAGLLPRILAHGIAITDTSRTAGPAQVRPKPEASETG